MEVIDRPWPVGQVYALCEGGVDPDLIQIVAYLEEDCPVAPTRVVYRILSPGSAISELFFDDEVKRLQEHGWIKELTVQKTFVTT